MALRAFVLAAAALVAAGSTALTKDLSRSDGGPRTPAEWCCVEGALLPLIETSAALDNQSVFDLNQIAPVSEAKPGLDGADWNCRRPDGTQRCFSALRKQ